MLLIKEKLPPGILTELEGFGLATEGWNINIMRGKLHELINIREMAYNESGCKPARDKWQAYPTRQRATSNNSSDLFTVPSFNISDKGKKFPCTFCNGDHFHDECIQYRTILSHKN